MDVSRQLLDRYQGLASSPAPSSGCPCAGVVGGEQVAAVAEAAALPETAAGLFARRTDSMVRFVEQLA